MQKRFRLIMETVQRVPEDFPMHEAGQMLYSEMAIVLNLVRGLKGRMGNQKLIQL